MASGRELITLQLGHYANFVGAHWWNIQQSSFCYDPEADFEREINHDCLFREGRTLGGEPTYTPRLVLFDLKGSLRALPKLGCLYEPAQEDHSVKWTGEVSVHSREAEEKNDFQRSIESQDFAEQTTGKEIDKPQSSFKENKRYSDEAVDLQEGDQNDGLSCATNCNLDEKVTVWSDYSSVHFHPKTIHFAGNYWRDDELRPFDVFGNGQELMQQESFVEELEDVVHFFAEECDSLQGFQVLADVYNGFGGLSSQVLEYLQDDFGTKSFITFGVSPALFPSDTSTPAAHRVLNTALSFAHLSQSSHMLAPLSMATDTWLRNGEAREFPHLSYKFGLPYHTSSVLAACVDTMTLPYRLDTAMNCSLGELLNTITFGGRKVASVMAAFPVPLRQESSLSSLLSMSMGSGNTDFLTPLSPGVRSINTVISQATVLRGVAPSLIHGHHQHKSPQSGGQKPLRDCSSAGEMLNFFFRNIHPGSAQTSWTVNQACTTKPPFPNIFTPQVQTNGLVARKNGRETHPGVFQTSMLSCANTSSATGDTLLSLAQCAHKVNIRKYHSFLEGGIELASFQEALELLENLSQQYALC